MYGDGHLIIYHWWRAPAVVFGGPFSHWSISPSEPSLTDNIEPNWTQEFGSHWDMEPTSFGSPV